MEENIYRYQKDPNFYSSIKISAEANKIKKNVLTKNRKS